MFTFLNERTYPSRCPHSDVCDSFLQQLHLLLYLCTEWKRGIRRRRSRRRDVLQKSAIILHTLMCFAKSFKALASPLKVVSCLQRKRHKTSYYQIRKLQERDCTSPTWWDRLFGEQSCRRWAEPQSSSPCAASGPLPTSDKLGSKKKREEGK